MNKSEFRKLIREEVRKTLKENSTPVISAPLHELLPAATIPISIPGSFIKTLKEFLWGHKRDAEPGETYYVMTPGKEKDLIGVVFSNWISSTMNSIDINELMDNFESTKSDYSIINNIKLEENQSFLPKNYTLLTK